MKKIILTATAVFAISFANAQDVKFGIKGGLNLSSATISGIDEPFFGEISSRTSFHFGGVAVIKITDKFTFQPELLLNSLGVKFNLTETQPQYFYDSSNNIKLTYLSIPLIAKFNIFNGLYLEGGPQIGILVDAKNESSVIETSNGFTISESGTKNAKDNFKSLDFGLNIGTSYNIENNMFFSARYYYGLSDLWKQASNTDLGLGYKNNCLQLSVGYMFK
jgi:hypothetical protein